MGQYVFLNILLHFLPDSAYDAVVSPWPVTQTTKLSCNLITQTMFMFNTSFNIPSAFSSSILFITVLFVISLYLSVSYIIYNIDPTSNLNGHWKMLNLEKLKGGQTQVGFEYRYGKKWYYGNLTKTKSRKFSSNDDC